MQTIDLGQKKLSRKEMDTMRNTIRVFPYCCVKKRKKSKNHLRNEKCEQYKYEMGLV